MANLVAAYELGLNALMLRYNLRYYTEFAWDPRAVNGRGILDCLKWISDDLIVLMPEKLPAREPVRRINQIKGEFHLLLADGLLDGARGNPGGPGDAGLHSVRRLWGELATLTKSTIRSRPGLYPWYCLGRAMAFCFLDLFDTERHRVLPSLSRLIKAAQQLPSARMKRIDVLNRLNAFDLSAASPLPLLSDLLNEGMELRKEMEVFDCEAPNVSAIHKVHKLDQRRELDDPLDIVFDPRQPYAIYRSKIHLISKHQGLILEEVMNGEGESVTSAEMQRKHPQLEEANISREVSKLPKPLKKLGSPPDPLTRTCPTQ